MLLVGQEIVIAILEDFLHARVLIWVGTGIPVSIIGTKLVDVANLVVSIPISGLGRFAVVAIGITSHRRISQIVSGHLSRNANDVSNEGIPPRTVVCRKTADITRHPRDIRKILPDSGIVVSQKCLIRRRCRGCNHYQH